ncbi:MAG: twin-arginine translocation signal domain-containing protein, partial [Hyphomicrobiales bacterium]
MPSETINRSRRHLLGGAAATIAAAELGLVPPARAQTGKGEGAAFGPLKEVDADLLRVGYLEAGHLSGPAALLLHGWPYDIHSFAEVVPLLAAAGYRVIVPYLRGYGTTR